MSQDTDMERRLAAVLAADVEGFSRLTDEDEIGTLRLLTAQRAILDAAIYRYRGRIANTAGDSVLAEFPSAVNAVQCAVEAQQALRDASASIPETRRVLFRIGIHVGDVMVRGSDLLGGGVNVAARLESLADAGGIVISAAAHEQVRKVLALAYIDLGQQQMKNIDEGVHAYAIGSAPSVRRSAMPSEIVKPSIVVLPFENMSGDCDQEYFADGITEEIITALSHLRTFPVTARNTSFTYKGEAVKPQRLAEELGVSYVLEGSVRRAAGRVRVTAQLIDARSGLHLWADRYDRSLDDVFAIQDEITLRIALALQPELTEAELRKGQIKRTDNLSAWDHYLRGMSQLTEQTCAANAEARAHFQKSIDLDSTYGEAWAGLSWSHLRDYEFKCSDNPRASLELGYTVAQQGVKLADRSAFTHYILSTAYVWREQMALSLKELDRTLELNPYFARAHLARGNRLELAGQTEEGIAALRQALELNPRDPERHTYLSFLSRALIVHGDYEEALQFIEHAAMIAPQNPDLQYRLAISLAHLDRVEEARAALARCDALRPGYIAMRRPWRPYNDDKRNSVFFAGMDRHGLRNAP